MARDMDLVRKIILICDAVKPGEPIPNVPEVEGYSETEVAYHIYLMGEAGLLKVADTTSCDSYTPQALILSMTWRGHDFADSAKSSAVWTKTKSVIGKLGGASFEVVFDVMKAAAKQQLKDLGQEYGLTFGD